MKKQRKSTVALQNEIVDLQGQIDRLSAQRESRAVRDNIYVFNDDDVDARAFDEFYRAYDEVHAKTRKFLLG